MCHRFLLMHAFLVHQLLALIHLFPFLSVNLRLNVKKLPGLVVMVSL